MSDVLSKDEDELEKIKTMVNQFNINLRDIKSSTELTLHSDILQYITAKNYWIAADIAKFSILKHYPGVACDINAILSNTVANFPNATYGFLINIYDPINGQNSEDPILIITKMIGVAYPDHPIVNANLDAIKANLNFIKNDSQVVKYLDTDDFRKFYTVAFYGTGTPLSYILRQVTKSGLAVLQKLDFPKDFKKNITVTEEGHDPLSLSFWGALKWHCQTSQAATEAWKTTILEMERKSDSFEKIRTNLSAKKENFTIPITSTSSFFASCSSRDTQNDKNFNYPDEANNLSKLDK